MLRRKSRIKHTIIYPAVKNFSREELQILSKRATELAVIKGTTPRWVKACFKLSYAACVLDALLSEPLMNYEGKY